MSLRNAGVCGPAGDKPQAFVGSREWIGAIELGYVLDERLGVASKVITVSSGAEMSTKAREIAQHFDSQGTPIMVIPYIRCFLLCKSAFSICVPHALSVFGGCYEKHL